MRGEDTNRGRKCSGGIRTGYYRSILCSLVKEGPYRVNQPWKQITCGAVISLLPQVLLQSYHHLFTWHRSPNSLLTSVRSVPHLFSSSRPGPSGSRSLRARARPPAGKGGEREENRDEPGVRYEREEIRTAGTETQPAVTSLQSPPYSRFPWLVHPRLTTLTGEETTVRRG